MTASRVIGGRYLVLDELRRDGAGVLWRAEDRMTGRAVAVKELTLPSGLAATQRLRFRDRLLREVRTAGSLGCPGVVAVHDVLTETGPDGIPREHVITELVEGRTVAELVAVEGSLDERSAITVGRALLAILRSAHERGLIHRDVRPETVVIGSGGRVRLTDFGVAGSGADIGPNPATLPPEGVTSPAGDLWAVGAVLFHAVHGSAYPGAGPARLRGPLGEAVSGLLEPDPQRRLGAGAATDLLDERTHRGPTVPPRLMAVLAVSVLLAFALGVLVGLAL